MIIDANIANELSEASTTRAQQVSTWLSKKKGKLVVGGKLTEEIYKTKFKRLLMEHLRSGNARLVSNSEILKAIKKIGSLNLMTSDDPHILGLALVSGARLLFSEDKSLQADFKNPEVIPAPRGKIFTRDNQGHLLNDPDLCPS